MTISRYILPIMRNVLDKSCRENKNTHFMLSNFFFRKSLFVRYVEKYGRARGAATDVTLWRIRVACWISKATCTRPRARTRARARTHTHTHTHTHIRNIFFCFSMTTMIHESASMLRYTTLSCVCVCVCVFAFVAPLCHILSY